ncbi:hypothetical protein ES703_52698 [subsurface metagenome]
MIVNWKKKNEGIGKSNPKHEGFGHGIKFSYHLIRKLGDIILCFLEFPLSS